MKARVQVKRTWRQDPEGRRSRILKAAARHFGRKGFRNARVDDIARAAGVAEGTVYHQFGTKQGLLVAVGSAYGRGLAEAAFGGVEEVFRVRDVSRIVDNIFRYVRETDGSLAAFLLANDPEEGGPARDANREQMLTTLERVLEGALQRGEIAGLHPRIAAEIQFGLVESALKDCFLRHGGADEALYRKEVSRCLTAYLSQNSVS